MIFHSTPDGPVACDQAGCFHARPFDAAHLMCMLLASNIMPRTTIDIDAGVLRRLKERKRREGKTLGQLVSELIAEALRHTEPAPPRKLGWTSRPMSALVDLEDKEAVRRALEEL
jgi:hypothetical protein